MFKFLAERWVDLVVAIVFAAAFAVVADLARIGSRLQGFVRKLRNKRAERSVTRLKDRIASLELYRENLGQRLTSDKALYVFTLQYILIALMVLAGGLFVMSYVSMITASLGFKEVASPIIIARIQAFSSLLAAGAFGFSMVICAAALKISTSFNTHEKIKKLILQLNAEINGMQKELFQLSAKSLVTSSSE